MCAWQCRFLKVISSLSAASACMRHIMLSSMELKIDDRISWLPIREADIVSGSYEQLILENADELLGKMDPQPRVLMIFVTCIDNLLGTDHEVFLGPLNEKYPDARTIVCFMNPITGDGPAPPAVTIQDTIYSLTGDAEQKDRAVNFIGSNLAIERDNELIGWLGQNGIESRHISQYKTFDEFREMGKSTLNIVTSPLALYAAKQMKLRKGIDYGYFPVSYSFDEIERDAAGVCEKLGIPAPDFSKRKTKSGRQDTGNAEKPCRAACFHRLCGDLPSLWACAPSFGVRLPSRHHFFLRMPARRTGGYELDSEKPPRGEGPPA